ncbi:MAG: helix-turn-helix domain-containing protein [Acidobacteriia bacterium]|nr:helix-turn-helix domain-containing protein [Terriglobia bacterium]
MIGKTRQKSIAQSPSKIEETFDAEVGKARGVVRRAPPAGKFMHSRRSPSPGLAAWIDHYWVVRWDLRGYEPYTAETLPHPNFQVVFEKGRSAVSGVFTGKFTRTLEGKSHVFGIKFTPGGFRPFLKAPASSFRNRTVPVRRIFGKDADALEVVLTGSSEENAMIEAANAFFRARIPQADKEVEAASLLVRRILEERDIRTVDDLVERTGIGKRTLQRIFNEYVGVSPKWVIRRYRLHELMERFNSGEQLDCARLAVELGYFDQAHLINDFRAIVGYSPTQYQRLAARDS